MESVNVTDQPDVTVQSSTVRKMSRAQRDEMEVAQSYRPEMEQHGSRMTTTDSGVVVRRSTRSNKGTAPLSFIDEHGFYLFKGYTMNNKGKVDVSPVQHAALMEEYNVRKHAADLRKMGRAQEAREILQRLQQNRMRALSMALETDATADVSAEEAEDAELEPVFVVHKHKEEGEVESDGEYQPEEEDEEEESDSESDSDDDEDEDEDDEEEEDEDDEEDEEDDEEEEDEDEDEFDDDDEDD